MRLTKNLNVICALAALLLAQGLATADGYKISWDSVNSGGGPVMGGGSTVTCSVGQTAACFIQSPDRLHWSGFWSGGIPAPILAMRVSDAKLLPAGAFVSVVGKVATSVAGDFSGFIYVEDENKTSGVRVVVPPGVASGLQRERSIVNVIGTTETGSNNERQISASMIVITSTKTGPLGPVTMGSTSVGGADLGVPPLGQFGVTGGSGANNVGLLVLTVGRVQEAGTDYLLISDGSPLPVRISTEGLTNLPVQGDYITVTGISSLYPSGADRLRLVLPRQRSDIWPP